MRQADRRAEFTGIFQNPATLARECYFFDFVLCRALASGAIAVLERVAVSHVLLLPLTFAY